MINHLFTSPRSLDLVPDCCKHTIIDEDLSTPIVYSIDNDQYLMPYLISPTNNILLPFQPLFHESISTDLSSIRHRAG